MKKSWSEEVVWMRAMCTGLILLSGVVCVMGCKQDRGDVGADISSVTQGSPPRQDASMEPAAIDEVDEGVADAMSAAKGEDAPRDPLIRAYDHAPISEEYHSLTVIWAGASQSEEVVLRSAPDEGSEEVAKVVVREGEVLRSLEDRVVVKKPRSFYPSREVAVSVQGEDGEQIVKLQPEQALLVYMYEGEGMCEVAVLVEGVKTPVIGAAICPDNGYVDMEWTTSEQGRRDLPEGATWWMLLDAGDGERGWGRFELSDLQLDLKIDERLGD